MAQLTDALGYSNDQPSSGYGNQEPSTDIVLFSNNDMDGMDTSQSAGPKDI